MSRFDLAFRALVGLEILALALYGTPAFWPVLLVPPVLFCAWFVVGLFRPQAQFFLPLVNRIKGEEKLVYLTFDDGPHPATTPALLGRLAEEDLLATFFVVGAQAQAHPALLLALAEAGHQIGHHSMHHKQGVAFSSAKQWRAELEAADQTFENILHWRPKLFRPPVGITTPSLAKALDGQGRIAVGWTCRSGDWFTKDPQKVARRILRSLKPGAIFLLHDHPHPGASALEVLDLILPQIRAQGYRFAALPSEPV